MHNTKFNATVSYPLTIPTTIRYNLKQAAFMQIQEELRHRERNKIEMRTDYSSGEHRVAVLASLGDGA